MNSKQMQIKLMTRTTQNEILDVICTLETKLQNITEKLLIEKLEKQSQYDLELLETLYSLDLNKMWTIYETIEDNGIRHMNSKEITTMYHDIQKMVQTHLN